MPGLRRLHLHFPVNFSPYEKFLRTNLKGFLILLLFMCINKLNMKLIDLINEKYLYPKGKSLKPGFGKMTKDIDKLFQYTKTWEKFEDEFRKRYKDYPKTPEANKELKDLWSMYHEIEERKTLTERLVNNVDLDDYASEFQDYFYKKYKNKNINGWQLSTDEMTGTFYWDKKGSKVNVLATPYWDGQQSLPVDVQNIETGDYVLQTKYPLDVTGDKKKDEETVLKMLKQVLSKVR